MSALGNLPKDARDACVALAYSTVWPAEEWALATQKLMGSGLPPDEMGLTRLIQLSLATRDAPTELADKMIEAFREATR